MGTTRNRIDTLMRDALWRSEENYRALTEAIPECIIRIDEHQTILFTNPNGARTVFGYEVEELIGKKLTMLVPPELREGHERGFGHYLATGQRTRNWLLLETLGLHKNGRRVPIGISYSEYVVNGTHYFVAVIRDITNRVAAEKAMVASERVNTLGRLVSGIMHEINNPLDAIGMNLYMLRVLNPTPEQIEYIDRAQEMLERCVAISRNTLSFARGNSKVVDVSVSKVIHGVLELFHARIARQSTKIVFKDEATRTVCASEVEVVQVFTNIIRNALDACGTGGVVTIHTFDDHDNQGREGVRTVIVDTGQGFTPESKANIGQPFFTTKSEDGTGLGLWITVQNVTKNGGLLKFRNAPSTHGAAFAVFLPVREVSVRKEAA